MFDYIAHEKIEKLSSLKAFPRTFFTEISNAKYIHVLGSAHTERQRQRPIQSQWKRQPKRQEAPLKFAACRSVWVSPKLSVDYLIF